MHIGIYIQATTTTICWCLITLGPMAFLCFLFCIPECMMDDGSTSAIFWKQEAPVAAAEGNFDFQEIASFLPVSLFFFSANRQKENLSKRKKKEKKRIFLSHHAITADSASTARRKVHFAARQCLTHEFLHEFPLIPFFLFFFFVYRLPIFPRTTGVYIYLSVKIRPCVNCLSAGKISRSLHFVLSLLPNSRQH